MAYLKKDRKTYSSGDVGC